jgi:hypothetical protein
VEIDLAKKEVTLAGALVLKRRWVHMEHKEIPPANIVTLPNFKIPDSRAASDNRISVKSAIAAMGL